MATGKVTTAGGNLMIRKSPNTGSAIVGKIPNGTTITITDITTVGGWKWGKVTYNGASGYSCIYQPGGGTWVKITETPEPAKKTPPTPKADPVKQTAPTTEGTSKGLDAALAKLMSTSINGGSPLKASTRMFGMPFQYAPFIDCRIPEVSKTLGRKFIENIILEAPILTVIPGKPYYLPSAKNKRGTSQMLMSAASGNFQDLSALGNNISADKLRYFDFQQDYIEYMKYVNLLCRVSAGFLEIGDVELDGVKLTKYNWMNYRYTSESYQSTLTNMVSSSVDAGKGVINTLKNFGASALKIATLGAIDLTDGTSKKDDKNQVQFDTDGGDKSVLDKLDSVLANMNYVQFYIDASASFSESASNSTGSSKLEGLFDTANDLSKELAFVVNAGGVDHASFDQFADKSLTSLTDTIQSRANGGIGGIFSRIVSVGSNVIKGESVVIPEIYQRSDYGKSYSISMTLTSPYNDRYSYYMNMLVPMMHILALAVPKQATANTYSSPFLIKAFLPGVFNCNLGIVESISIDKNINGDGLSVDGLPTEIKVTINIKDLYSELMMTPSTDPMMFLSNSSLIDYLAVNCGVDLVLPQMDKKIKYLIDVLKTSVTDIPENIKGEIIKSVDRIIAGWTSIN